MSDSFDPYHVWLGIASHHQPPNHYRLLGVDVFSDDADVISNAADRQMAHVRTFQSGRHAEHSQKLLSELAAARLCLLDEKKRAAYDKQLRATDPSKAKSSASRAGSMPKPSTTAPPAQARRVAAQQPRQPAAAPRPAAPTGFDGAIETETTTVSRAPSARPQQQPAILVGIAAAVVLLIAGGVWMLAGGDDHVASQGAARTSEKTTVGERQQSQTAADNEPKAGIVAAVSKTRQPRVSIGRPAEPESNPNPKLGGILEQAPGSEPKSPQPVPEGTFALRFGQRSRVELVNSKGIVALDKPFSAEAWVKFEQDAGDHIHIIFGNYLWSIKHPSAPNLGSAGWGFMLRGAGRRAFGLQVASRGGAKTHASTLAENLTSDWHHVAMCCDGRLTTFYLDGKRIHQRNPAPDQIPDSPLGFCLGGTDYHNSGHCLNGAVRGFRLSSNVRYRDEFSPATVFDQDEHALILLDFARATPG